VYTGRPEPPRDVRVVTCEADFVDLTWVTSDDNNSPIIEYIVYYTDSSAEDPDELVVGLRMVARREESSSPGTTISGVVSAKPWVKYEYFVVARNALGMSEKASQSDEGAAAVCETPQAAPRRNPKDVCTRLGRPNQLVIVWEVCTDSHSPAEHISWGALQGGLGEPWPTHNFGWVGHNACGPTNNWPVGCMFVNSQKN